jgi:acyl-CoA thioesterase II
MFDLEPHGPDTFVGTGPRYPWGGLYGGQIVAQALRAAALSVDEGFVPHSIRAYFIRPGDHTEPVRYEVDRIRNGRSFVTRRVVARQAIGAILNAECSMHRGEDSPELQSVSMPQVAGPDSTTNTSFSPHFDRRWVEASRPDDRRDGSGRVSAWMRVLDLTAHGTGDGAAAGAADDPVLHQAWTAYISDDLPSDAVRHARVAADPAVEPDRVFGVSLDHTVWFHRPIDASRWHLYDMTCHHYFQGRGLAFGHVFDEAGLHVATVAQEVLLRTRRAPDR